MPPRPVRRELAGGVVRVPTRVVASVDENNPPRASVRVRFGMFATTGRRVNDATDPTRETNDDEAPAATYGFTGIGGAALFLADFERAVSFYTAVLGAPEYVYGTGTCAWRLGSSWLTLLRGQSGNPTNVEIILEMTTPAEAEKLHAAFVAAGAEGGEVSDQVMIVPVRYCPIVDPFGTNLLIISPLGADA